MANIGPGSGEKGEPYSGVQALFNADVHAVMPGWAPRQDWLVLAGGEILHVYDTLFEPLAAKNTQ
jgi:hypothetical protein